MRYWWVNQNQTYRHEVQGGYLWSPKRNANRGRNPFYESMREVSPGDLIFSFMDTRILAIGVAQSYCWESPKPLAFGRAGQNWGDIGWRVSVRFSELTNKIRPKDHIEVRGPQASTARKWTSHWPLWPPRSPPLNNPCGRSARAIRRCGVDGG